MRTTTFTFFDYLPDFGARAPEAPRRRARSASAPSPASAPRRSRCDLVGRGSEPQSRDFRADPQSARQARRDRRRHLDAVPRPGLHGRAGAAGLLGLAARDRAEARARAHCASRSPRSASPPPALASLLPAPSQLAAADRPRRRRRRRACSGCRATCSRRSKIEMVVVGRRAVGDGDPVDHAPRSAIGLAADVEEDERERQTAAPRRAPEPADAEEDDSDGEPGFGLVSLGALIHTALAIKGAMRRLFRRRPRPSLGSAPPPRAPWLNRESPDFAAPLDEFAPAVEAGFAPPTAPARTRPASPPAPAPTAPAPAAASRVAAPAGRDEARHAASSARCSPRCSTARPINCRRSRCWPSRRS